MSLEITGTNAARDKGLFPLNAPIVDSLSSKKWEEIDGQKKIFN